MFTHRGVEQLAARRAHNPEVVGSSPTSATRMIERRKVYNFKLLSNFLFHKLRLKNIIKELNDNSLYDIIYKEF